MKKLFSLFLLLCMTILVFAVPALAAECEVYDLHEYIDVPFSVDLDGDGANEIFAVDCYRNFIWKYLFHINGTQFVFDSFWKGSYSDFAIVDLDETDRFKEIFVFFDHKQDWANVFRYDGGKLYDLTELLDIPDSETDEPLSVSAGNGTLTVTRGNEVHTFNSFAFKEAYELTGIGDGEDGAYDQYPVEFNGERMTFDQLPINKKDRILVPIRAIFEKMGYTMEWNDTTKTALAKKGTDYITVQVGNKQIIYSTDGVSGTYECDVAPMIAGGRTMIPLRGVAECAGCTVLWDEEIAKITTN